MNKEIRVLNYVILGVRIEYDSQIKEDSHSRKLAPYPIEDFADYLSDFYNPMCYY